MLRVRKGERKTEKNKTVLLYYLLGARAPIVAIGWREQLLCNGLTSLLVLTQHGEVAILILA